MHITSPVFSNNEHIPSRYTCEGENVNPPLKFSNIPSHAKSLVLIVEDPDAPSKVWKHWLVYNIEPTSEGIEENNKVEIGEEGLTDFGVKGYGGPCPPSGTHRYFFRLYALDIQLRIEGHPNVDTVRECMKDHIIDEAELVGLYKKSS